MHRHGHSELRQDIAYAARTLRQHYGFALVVVLILALGIGANTATFTVVDALLLRPLPVSHPERLVTIGDPRRTGSLSEGTPRTDLASYPLYLDVRDGTRLLEGVYATGRTNRLDVRIEGASTGAGMSDGEAEHPRGRLVSGNFFSVLGVRARLGRTFTAAEDRVAGGGPVAVISDAYWRTRFAGERSAIGRTISVNGVPLTIVGVTPPGFTGDIVGQPIDLWLPLTMQPLLMPHEPRLADRHICWLLLMGRLRPGVTPAQARSEITALETRSLLDHAAGDEVEPIRGELRDAPVQVGPGARGFSYYRATYAPALYTLAAAVLLVLLVVCANVANLMLARGTTRGREISVRLALGAGRWRVVRQLMTESAMLALAGGALGLLLAHWGSTALLELAAGGPDPIPLDVGLDGRILGFTAALALATVVLFGLVPALRATRLDLAGALRAQGRGVQGTAGDGRFPLGKALVVTQVALSTLLLVGTGLLVRSTQRLQGADIGLDRDQLVIARVDAGRAGYEGERLAALLRDLTARLGRLPGVAAVSFSENGLFSGTESGTSLQVEGFTARAADDTVVAYDDVGPDYFNAIGAHLLRGRDVEPHDNEAGQRVAVLNRTMARFYFPSGDAIGHHLTISDTAYEIVGVVGDVEEHTLRAPPERRLYLATLQMSPMPSNIKFEIRATGDPARLVQPVRRTLVAADPSLSVLSVDPLDALIRESIGQDRLLASVVSVFGTLALLLAALGLYGVMAYATVRRTAEFGLRMALGARRGDVTLMMLREAMMLMAAGVIVGLPIALAATRFLRSQLFGIQPLDAPSFVLAVAVLGVSAAVAGALPALRAARVSPLEALRAE